MSRIPLHGAQWGVLALLLGAMGLEFIFSPYWHPFIQDNLGGTGADGKQKLKISSEGFIVVAFLVFATILILTLTDTARRGLCGRRTAAASGRTRARTAHH